MPMSILFPGPRFFVCENFFFLLTLVSNVSISLVSSELQSSTTIISSNKLSISFIVSQYFAARYKLKLIVLKVISSQNNYIFKC